MNSSTSHKPPVYRQSLRYSIIIKVGGGGGAGKERIRLDPRHVVARERVHHRVRAAGRSGKARPGQVVRRGAIVHLGGEQGCND